MQAFLLSNCKQLLTIIPVRLLKTDFANTLFYWQLKNPETARCLYLGGFVDKRYL